jgi:diguanylate cyclase (GGDEF)-like protein/PAS domain S-box-containing protein
MPRLDSPVRPDATASEQLLASIVESSDDAVIARTPEGVITSWNSGAEKLYGYSADEAIGQPSSILLPREGLEEESVALEKALRGEHSDHYESERRRKDGDPIRVSLSVSPIEDPDGAIVGVSTIEHEALGENELEASFRSTFDHAPIGMALVSIDPGRVGRFLRVNEALCELTGYTREQLSASDFQTITHPADLDRDLASMTELMGGRLGSYQLEQRLLHAGRHAAWVMVNASLIRDGRGTPRFCIRQVQDIEERKRFEGQLQQLADHDPLTGLFNRRRFVRELSSRIAYDRRYEEGAALLLLDVDDFKFVNDTLGHSVGDEVINAVASILRERVRETDVLARLGGDEFAVLLPQATENEAEILASNLVTAVREGSPVVLGEGRPPVTISVGVTAFHSPNGEHTADGLLDDADRAMYEAKEGGRDRTALSSSEHHTPTRGRVNWPDRLRRALRRDEFILHCQPVLDLGSNRVSQYELLLRLPGDEEELILPAAFLYTAERFGLILDIDRWVITQAMQLVADRHQTAPDLRLEVNLSGPSVSDPGLPGFIERQLEATGTDPGRLVFEVTETAALANVDQARKFAARLAEIGCGFAIDDFGAGFGSFYYLKYMLFDYVKIDGEFIRNLPSSSTDQLILDSIVQMSRGLGKKTIAEFVGNEETVEVLRDHGVDYAQGYHLGRPGPLAEALAA